MLQNKRWKKRQIFLFLIPLLIYYCIPLGHTPTWIEPNQSTRMYTAISIYEYGQFNIDLPIKKFGKPGDIVKTKGHYYSNKAPGSSFLFIPALAIYNLSLIHI